GRGPEGYGDTEAIEALHKREARYKNGSHVAILAASPTAVRGPHVPTLKLDEVDEIEPDIRESAMGMAMEIRGARASVLMTSTWHRVAGPMAELVERGKAGAFPVDTYCIFEVLERCPDERSGPNLENCPGCPLVGWCHADCRPGDPAGPGAVGPALPRARRSGGYYATDALLHKLQAVSLRVFESDYLCLRPRAAGAWFTMFDEAVHVSLGSEFDPALPVHLAVDPGVCTGAVWFQCGARRDGRGHRITVF